MNKLSNLTYLLLNDEVVLMISDSYSGIPTLCYEPDVVIASEKIINKYKPTFLFRENKVRYITL